MNRLGDWFNGNGDFKRFVSKNSEQIKKILIVLILIVIAMSVNFFNKTREEAEFPSIEDGGDLVTTQEKSEKSESESQYIYIDIGGAVENPKLAKLATGSRVEDAIEEAGGVTDEADLSGINRADFLEDGEKVFIPEVVKDVDGNVVNVNNGNNATSQPMGKSGSSYNNSLREKININTADSTKLQTLTGVGPATAQKIIDYRDANGKFETPEDLKNVSGIGDKTFEKLKDDITT